MSSKRRVASSGVECGNCGVKHRILTEIECRDRSMPEKTLQSRIVARAKRRGWRVAHAGKGWVGDAETGKGQFVTQMAKGFPDLLLLHAKAGRALVIECKKELGEFEEGQEDWLLDFNACGIPAVVCRPSDLRLGRVDAILAV